ncbi:lipase member H-like [Etheostoma cragini]|uniref:lipase member H-like n=1 Tax=Etheostoma cragini TaxID=417921 RepID=UPI00155F2E36|nr:lipase member H-like [Etheostoma cragini]
MGTALYVRLLLYTRSNLACGRELRHHRLSSQPLFHLSRPTAFVIHGYRPTGAPPIWIDHLVHLLSEQEDMNVVVVDWNKGAANLNYFTAVTYTREAAYNLTGFIRTMQEEGASLSSVHLIGVSLGAHLAGYVGANLKGKIGRITAGSLEQDKDFYRGSRGTHCRPIWYQESTRSPSRPRSLQGSILPTTTETSERKTERRRDGGEGALNAE